MYGSSFVPALFADWAGHLVEAAGIAPGEAVLDGLRHRDRGPHGRRLMGDAAAVGLDVNEAC